MNSKKQVVRRKSIILGLVRRQSRENDISLGIIKNHKSYRDISKHCYKFIKSVGKAVSLFEEELLKIINLPDIGIVRQSFINDDKQLPLPIVGEFRNLNKIVSIHELVEFKKPITSDLLNQIDLILTSLQNAVINEKNSIRFNESDIYNNFFYSILTVGLPQENISTENIKNRYIDSEINNLYDEGRRNIKNKIKIEFKENIVKNISNTSDMYKNLLKVAKKLHNEIGEGQMWYWKKFAFSKAKYIIQLTNQTKTH